MLRSFCSFACRIVGGTALILLAPLTCGGCSGATNLGSDTAQSQDVAAGQTLDVNQYIAQSSDNTQSSNVALGTRFAQAAALEPNAAQLAFLADPSAQPPMPTSGENSDLHWASFVVTLYPSNNGRPSPVDIMQHGLDNCDADAALAALAWGHPLFIQSIVSTTGADTFAVKMYRPDGQALLVAVNNQFAAASDGTIAAVSGRGGQANWATVVEKAMLKYNAVWGVCTGDGLAQIAGIGSEFALPMLTGSGLSYAFARGVLTSDQLRQEALDALGHGMMLTGGFGVVTAIDGYETVTAHGYTILPPSSGQTMLTMRNPWGLATNASTQAYDASDDGVIDVPLNDALAQTIDLRVIDPGAAGIAACTTIYQPDPSRRATPADVSSIVRHIEARAARHAGL